LTETLLPDRRYFLELEKRLASLHRLLMIEMNLAQETGPAALPEELLAALTGLGRAIELAAELSHLPNDRV
jgi:hypothetical protein